MKTVFVVFNVKNLMVESVWSTRELAEAAVLYHEMNSRTHRKDLPISERFIDATVLPASMR